MFQANEIQRLENELADLRTRVWSLEREKRIYVPVHGLERHTQMNVSAAVSSIIEHLGLTYKHTFEKRELVKVKKT